MAEPEDDRPRTAASTSGSSTLFVFVPAGLAVSVAEELPRLAARGRERLGVRVSSARAVGQFAVKAGHDELRAAVARAGPPPAGRAPGAAPTVGPRRRRPPPAAGGHRGRRRPSAADPTVAAGPVGRPVAAVATGTSRRWPPSPSPGFDTLSASQVVQRLDGLNRAELVSVRAYEASTRGRRTILSRVDQLLDERS